MLAMLNKIIKSQEFLCSIIAYENKTCQLLKVLMTKCGYNKILLSIIKLIAPQIDTMKNKNNLQMTIMNYKNKYG